MRTTIIALILAIITIAPIFYIAYYYDGSQPQVESMPVPPGSGYATVDFQTRPEVIEIKTGVTLDVLSCKVVDGYKFALYLEGNKWIMAHLSVATKEEAVPLVIEWLNSAEPPPPTVTLLRKVGDYWIVDFHLTHKGQRINMISLLRSEGLLLDN